MSVVFTFRERARGNVSTPVVLWAIAMTVVLFMEIVNPSALVTVSGFALTALLGGFLGWRRRMGTVVVAPFVSWMFAWFPMEIASMIHFGILKGFLLGLVIITFGWIAIGFVELAWLGMVAMLVRSIHGHSPEDRVVIIDPDNH
ncbi:MAG: hypothetical protein WA860_04390 [Acidimicrobiales bacterium]|jgi:hypothetical protein